MVSNLVADAARSTIEPLLEPDERLLWAGKPNPLAYAMRKRQRFTYSVGAAIIILIIAFTVKIQPDPRIVWLIAPFAFIGILAEPVWEWWRARDVTYGVTDKRIVISKKPRRYLGGGETRVQPETISQRPAPGGRDLTFGTETVVSKIRTESGRNRTRTRQRYLGFFGIPDADAVEQIIRQHLTA